MRVTMLDHLLQPLAGDSATGDDLSFSPEFDAIAEARRFDDPTLPLGDWKERGKDPKAADWPAVQALCTQLLANRSKDLRLAAWLTEALAHEHGLDGLARGLRLQAGLVERWWTELHPRGDDGDDELRVGALSWLLKTLTGLVRALPEGPAPSTRADARAAVDALAALQKAVDGRLGADGPSFTAAREALEEAAHALPADPSAAPVVANGGAPRPADTAAGGPLATREQALRQLREVADFFRRTEPHSPVAYLADKAARWGTMDLHLWLRQVVKDEGTLARLEEMLGVEPPRPN